MPSRTLTVDLFSDVACPWCFVGSRRLSRVLAELDPSIRVLLRQHTYMLNPDLPPEGIDLLAHLRSRYGEDLAPMFARVEEEAAEAGIALELSRVTRGYSTLSAHTLLRYALSKGTQQALSDALFGACFLEQRDVSDPGVLTDVATRHGFEQGEVAMLLSDPEEARITRREAERARQMGISAVPFFVFQGKLTLSGAQSTEELRGAIAQALDLRKAATA